MNEKTCRLCGHNYDYMKTDDQATCPLCGDTGNQRPRMNLDQPPSWAAGAADLDWLRARFEGVMTDKLELELKTLSERIASDPVRFHEVREELARRRTVKDEQPAPKTTDEARQDKEEMDKKTYQALLLKVTAMEAEQAKLAVEAEVAKAAQREAEARLALITKHVKPPFGGTSTQADALIEDLRKASKDAFLNYAAGDRESIYALELLRKHNLL